MREKLIELLMTVPTPPNMISVGYRCGEIGGRLFNAAIVADHLIAHGMTISTEARPLEEWHEDIGDALWWRFPIEEPPYVGSPLDCAWTGYHTHWTPIICPEPPKGE